MEGWNHGNGRKHTGKIRREAKRARELCEEEEKHHGVSGDQRFFRKYGVVFGVWLVYSVCVAISDLTYKNQELAIQVSLLNCENAQQIRTLNEFKEDYELVKK